VILFCLICLTSAGWETVTDQNGIRVERRSLPALPLPELRATTHTSYSPEQVFNVVWDTPSYPSFVRYAKTMKVLRETERTNGRERIIYQQNAVPIIKLRECTVRSWYERDPSGALIQIWWEQANALGPPPSSDVVRLEQNSGSWTLERTSDGGTDITYVIATEGGGAIPAWMVRKAQVDSTPDFLRTILARVKSLAERQGTR
jgi:hypothetical protein